MVDGLIDNIDLLIDAGIALILGLAEGLIEALPRLIEKVPEIIQKLFDAFVRNFPKIAEAGGELIGKLVAGIVGSFWKLLEVAPQLIANIVNGIKAGYQELLNVGKYLIEGLWNGISGMANWVADKIKGFAGNIVNNMKDALGIHSPSTVMRDLVGRYIPQGVAVGIEADTDTALKAIDEMNNEIERKMTNAVYTEMGKINTNATVKANNSLFNVINVNSTIEGKVELEGRKVGRLTAPYTTQTIKNGGVYK